MPSIMTRNLLKVASSILFIITATMFAAVYSLGASGTLTVSGTQWGVTSQYLGANEGSSQFNTSDLVDLGINTYRVYGGMSWLGAH